MSEFVPDYWITSVYWANSAEDGPPFSCEQTKHTSLQSAIQHADSWFAVNAGYTAVRAWDKTGLSSRLVQWKAAP